MYADNRGRRCAFDPLSVFAKVNCCLRLKDDRFIALAENWSMFMGNYDAFVQEANFVDTATEIGSTERWGNIRTG